jgi:hypothetical protein
MRWKNNQAHKGQMRNAYKMLGIRLKGERPLGIPSYRRDDDIKIGLKEIY